MDPLTELFLIALICVCVERFLGILNYKPAVVIQGNYRCSLIHNGHIMS